MSSWSLHNGRGGIHRRVRLDIVLWICCGLVLIAGLAITVRGWLINRSVAEQVATLQHSGHSTDPTGNSVDIPDESEPPRDALGGYRVAADLPRAIRIPSLDVEARILRMGTKANNEMETPASIYDAGWYDGSAKPGEAGAVVIDGHVSGPTKPGVFTRLKSLKPGDTVQIELGSRKVLTYKVIKVKAVAADKVDMNELLTPVSRDGKGLNLITCTGRFNASTSHFEDRLLVFAEQQ